MKKFVMMVLVALVAISASAASIDWGFTGITTSAKRIKDSAGNDFSGNIYLILASDATTLDDSSATAFEASLASISLGSQAVADGKISSTATATSDKLANNTTEYAFNIVVYDGKGFYLSASNSNYAYVNGVDDPTQVTFTAQQIGATYTKNNSIAFTKVPEPASAMLALAGVAMLIRRRK